MVKKRIIAHFMHEDELAAVKQKMPEGVETEAYVVGDVDEDDIPELQQQGIIVQEVQMPEEDVSPEAPGRISSLLDPSNSSLQSRKNCWNGIRFIRGMIRHTPFQ